MNRITQVDPTTATGKTRELFEAVQAKLGIVPNVFRVLGNSPAALAGLLNLNRALSEGYLDAKVREQIALAVAETNLCNYCLSAHSAIGCQIGLSDQDVAAARCASSSAGKTDAILKFARSVVVNRGELGDTELQEAREAGLSDGEIVEIVANVAANILTNYLNHVAGTVVDFPEVRTGEIEAATESCSTGCACSH
jgi:uncharacterized peroxidase-related enzyme